MKTENEMLAAMGAAGLGFENARDSLNVAVVDGAEIIEYDERAAILELIKTAGSASRAVALLIKRIQSRDNRGVDDGR